MIIDTHVHIWEMPPVAPVGPTAPSWTAMPDEPGTAEELLADMDANGVDKTVLVQTSWSTWDNGYIADSVQKYPDRFISHGLIDPQADNASQIRYWVEERGLAGFRLHPMYYDDEPILTVARNAPMWEAIAGVGAVIQLHMRPEHAPQVEFAAERYPGVPLILDHMSYPNVADAPEFAPYQPIINLARYPNVYVKISDVAGRSERGFPYRDVQPVIRRLYEAFGIDRMMWGTGYPGHHRTKHGWPTLAEELRSVREGLDWLTDAERERMLGGTAGAVWGVD